MRDPHVRWCERGRLVTAPYSISLFVVTSNQYSVSPIGQAGYTNELTEETVFGTCDNLADVLGSTNWKLSRWKVVVNNVSK